MKACVLKGIGDLQYVTIDTPVPQKDEALIKIKAAGICGSDIGRVYKTGTYHFPTIPGHEFSGEVVDANGCENIKNGMRAAVFPMLPCFSCSACSIGEYAQCQNYDYYGSRRDGGFAEYIAVKKWNLIEISENISYEEAAMCEPAAVAVHAVSQANVKLGDTAAVFGAGTIGVILLKLLRRMGAEKIIAVDIDKAKLDFAKSLGFEYCIDSTSCDVEAEIKKITEGRGINVTIEGTGVSEALSQCLESAAPFGSVVLMGNPYGDINLPQKKYWNILRKQLKLFGTWNSGYNIFKNDWRTALNLMPYLELDKLITHKYPLSDYIEAFGVMKSRDIFKQKVMFLP